MKKVKFSDTIISSGPCSKLYRRKIFNKFCFDIPRNIVHGEDLLMNIRLAFNTQKEVMILPSVIYNYRKRDDGCDNTFKTSPEYENTFFKYSILSIPAEHLSIYYKDTIIRRTRRLEHFIAYRFKPERNWFDSEFHSKVISDIKTYKFKLHPIKLFTIRFSNLFLRAFPVFLLKLKFKLRKLF